MGVKPHELTQLRSTRWACRYKNYHNVKINYETIINALEEINNNRNKFAVCLLKRIKKAHFIYISWYFINYRLIKSNFTKKDATLGQETLAINGVMSTLQEKVLINVLNYCGMI